MQTIAVSLSWAGSTPYVFAGGSVALFTLLLSCIHLLPAPRVSPAGRHRCSVDGSPLLRVPSALGCRQLDLLFSALLVCSVMFAFIFASVSRSVLPQQT